MTPEITSAIQDLCDRADDAVEEGNTAVAVALYREALAKVPAPAHMWAVSSWILGSVAEAHYLAGEHAAARDAIDEAFACDGAIGNAFLHLRRGQIELHLGDKGRGRDELVRALARGGEEVFAGEDPKYLAMAREASDPGDA